MTAYSVYTDLPAEDVDDIILEIFQHWVSFALGEAEIGGHRLKHPTGRYAQSLSIRRYNGSASAYHVAMVADEKIAPEAAWIEEGHAAVDFIARFPGRTFKMHRGEEGQYGSAGYGEPVIPRKTRLAMGAHISSANRRTMWAVAREQGDTGFATVPHQRDPSKPGQWIIPAMEAYAPARFLKDLLNDQLHQRRSGR